MFEFRAGRKRVVKSVSTVEEAKELMREMIKIRNNDSLWENIDVKTGHLRAVDELEKLLSLLEKKLNPNIFENIVYAVVQSGVGLDLGNSKNTCEFGEKRFSDMIKVCNKFGKKSKEHNGDYLSVDEYKLRFDLGMDAINIAPQFGQLETLCYLEEMGDDIEDYYKICYDSKRWVKWVSKDFVPENNKKELIKICGHYVFSDEEFKSIAPNIDDKIKKSITDRLLEITNA